MLIKSTLTLAALSLLIAAPLQATEEGASFKKLDADANGYISPEEAQSNTNLSARWNDLDADKNNLLDMSEFSAFEGEAGMEGQAPASTPAQ